jgi:hypothetical protein
MTVAYAHAGMVVAENLALGLLDTVASKKNYNCGFENIQIHHIKDEYIGKSNLIVSFHIEIVITATFMDKDYSKVFHFMILIHKHI